MANLLQDRANWAGPLDPPPYPEFTPYYETDATVVYVLPEYPGGGGELMLLAVEPQPGDTIEGTIYAGVQWSFNHGPNLVGYFSLADNSLLASWPLETSSGNPPAVSEISIPAVAGYFAVVAQNDESPVYEYGLQVQITAGGAPAAGCFWTDIVGMDQQCSAGAGGVAVGYLEAWQGDTPDFMSIIWAGAPAFAVPEEPIEYPAPMEVSLFPSGTEFVATASGPGAGGSGGTDVTSAVSLGTDSLTVSGAYAAPFSFGFGPRYVRISIYVEGGTFAGLGSDFVRQNDQFIRGELGSFESRVGQASWSLTATVTMPGLAGNVNVHCSLGYSFTEIGVQGVPASGSGVYSFTGSSNVDTLDWINAAGNQLGHSVGVAGVCDQNIAASNVYVSASASNMKIAVPPLRKVIARIKSLVFFTEEQMNGYSMFEFPPLSDGAAVAKALAVIDTGWGFVIPVGFGKGCLVGELVAEEDQATSLGAMKINLI